MIRRVLVICAIATAFVFPTAAEAAKPQLFTVPSTVTNSQVQSFEFTIASPIAYFCSMDGVLVAPCVSPMSFSGLAEGDHTFEVWATYMAPGPDICTWFPDPIGEICTPGPPMPTGSEASLFSYRIDRTPPNVTFSGEPKQGSSIRNRIALIAFSAEAGSTYSCTFDQRTPEPCESPVEWRNLEAGLHRVKIQATDAAGNQGPASSLEFAVNTRSITYRSINKTSAKRCLKRKLKRRGKVVRTKSGKIRYKTTCKRVRF